MNVKQFIRVAVTITAVVLTASYAVAQGNSGGHGNGGGGGGGGGAGQNGGGVIYFSYDYELYTMNDDGSGVELAAGFPSGSFGEPSRELHAGKRWIAQRQSVPGENYPDGSRRQEFVALSDAGDIVPLHIEADLSPTEPKWGVADGFLSWVGQRFDIDPESQNYGEVVEGGLYVTPLAFDGDGNVAGNGGASLLLVSRDLLDGYEIRNYDWSPDGLAFVFDTQAFPSLPMEPGGQLLIFDLQTETLNVVLSDVIVRLPRWSPAGDKLMIYYGGDGAGWPGTWVMNIDGSGLKKVRAGAAGTQANPGVWSPTGSHLLYQHRDSYAIDSYIVRTTSDGKRATRITDESMGSGLMAISTFGWRE
jgi:hypothetical protein